MYTKLIAEVTKLFDTDKITGPVRDVLKVLIQLQSHITAALSTTATPTIEQIQEIENLIRQTREAAGERFTSFSAPAEAPEVVEGIRSFVGKDGRVNLRPEMWTQLNRILDGKKRAIIATGLRDFRVRPLSASLETSLGKLSTLATSQYLRDWPLDFKKDIAPQLQEILPSGHNDGSTYYLKLTPAISSILPIANFSADNIIAMGGETYLIADSDGKLELEREIFQRLLNGYNGHAGYIEGMENFFAQRLREINNNQAMGGLLSEQAKQEALKQEYLKQARFYTQIAVLSEKYSTPETAGTAAKEWLEKAAAKIDLAEPSNTQANASRRREILENFYNASAEKQGVPLRTGRLASGSGGHRLRNGLILGAFLILLVSGGLAIYWSRRTDETISVVDLDEQAEEEMENFRREIQEAVENGDIDGARNTIEEALNNGLVADNEAFLEEIRDYEQLLDAYENTDTAARDVTNNPGRFLTIQEAQETFETIIEYGPDGKENGEDGIDGLETILENDGKPYPEDSAIAETGRTLIERLREIPQPEETDDQREARIAAEEAEADAEARRREETEAERRRAAEKEEEQRRIDQEEAEQRRAAAEEEQRVAAAEQARISIFNHLSENSQEYAARLMNINTYDTVNGITVTGNDKVLAKQLRDNLIAVIRAKGDGYTSAVLAALDKDISTLFQHYNYIEAGGG